MRSWRHVLFLACAAFGAMAGGCTALLGDFGVASEAGDAGDASISDRDGAIDGGASADGSRGDATANADGTGGDGDSTVRADADSGDGDSTVGADADHGDAAASADVASGDAPSGDGGADCGPSPCKPPCLQDTDCAAGDYCANGACLVQKSQGGSPCTRDGECQTGLSCSLEGICCNAPCTGACQLCNSSGMCVPVPANQQPRTGHPACANGGTAPCGGYCDGVDIGCFYPTTACRTASCGCYPANGCTSSPTQNCAAGSCPNPIYNSCNGFACDTTGTACGQVCDPINDTGCYGLNCCHTVFTGACFHNCTSTCPASGTCS